MKNDSTFLVCLGVISLVISILLGILVIPVQSFTPAFVDAGTQRTNSLFSTLLLIAAAITGIASLAAGIYGVAGMLDSSAAHTVQINSQTESIPIIPTQCQGFVEQHIN